MNYRVVFSPLARFSPIAAVPRFWRRPRLRGAGRGLSLLSLLLGPALSRSVNWGRVVIGLRASLASRAGPVSSGGAWAGSIPAMPTGAPDWADYVNAEGELFSDGFEDEYRDFLTDVYGTILVAGYEFDAGAIVREMDPIAFRCGMLDWVDGRVQDGDLRRIED